MSKKILMKKEDLKTGMVVETRELKRYIVFYECNNLVSDNEYDKLSCYSEDLRNVDFKERDIIKVYLMNYGFILENLYCNDCLDLIWERKEEKQKPQLTERERAYLKAYSYDYKWIARDADGDLYIYENQPIKDNYHEQYNDQDGKYINISDISGVILSFIKWEDEEPYNIKELLGEE